MLDLCMPSYGMKQCTTNTAVDTNYPNRKPQGAYKMV